MGIDPVSLAITVALNAAMMAVTMAQTIEGPRTADLSVTVADYGTPLNNFYGKRRFEVPAFYAEGIREEKIRRKTKGGKYNEYVYYGTWAVAIAEHEIETINRVWFDRHLVYDNSNTGPPSIEEIFASIVNKSAPGAPRLSGKTYRLYYGTETQLPDPRIQLKVDAEDGVDTTPAYRGVAYIMFEEMPLEKFGNRFPQVSVEAIRATDPAYPYFTTTDDIGNSRLWNTGFNQDYSRLIYGTSDFIILDTATRSVVSKGTFPVSLNLSNTVAYKRRGTFLAVSGNNRYLYEISADGLSYTIFQDFGSGTSQQQDEVYVLFDGWDREWFFTVPYSILTGFFLGQGLFINSKQFYGVDYFGQSYKPINWFKDTYGDIWGMFIDPGGGTEVIFYRWVNTSGRTTTDTVSVTGLSSYGIISDGAAVHYRDNDVDHFAFHMDHDDLYTADVETGVVTNHVAAGSLDVYNTQKQFNACLVGSGTIWLNYTEYSLKDWSVVRTVPRASWPEPADSDGVIYDPVQNALIGWPQFGGKITWRYLDRVSSSNPTLASVMNDICQKVGLDSSNYDTSALNQTLDGYSWTMGPASDIAGPLLELYDSDVRPHDDGIEFIKRDGSATSTITKEYMARSSNEDPLVKTSLIPDVDLPYRIFLNFADVDADQTPNTAVAQRSGDSVDTSNELPVDMTTLALPPDDADALTKRALRVRWFEREIHELKVTPLELAMEPGDVHTLEISGSEFTARLVKMDIKANGLIDTKWVNTDPAIHAILTGYGAPLSGRAASVLLIPGLSEAFVIDGPLCNDADNQTNPLVYVAGGPIDPDVFWPGMEIARSDVGDELESYVLSWDAVSATLSTTWGIVTTTLPDAVPFVFDRGTTLTVTFKNGTPTSSTEEAILANETLNLVAIGSHETGWEYVQFVTATLISGTTYELTTLLRGARGSEQFMSTHSAGERLVMISPNTKVHSIGIDEYRDEIYYRGITTGRAITSAPAFSYTFEAVSHKPYAPALVKIVPNGADYDFSWIRRTRIGGNNIDGQDVPLGETSESYKVLIMDGSTIVRTITSTSESATYTEAQQISDWGSAQSSLTIKVAQVSPNLTIDGYYTEAVF